MLFTRLFDAANDPIMGSIVDRTRTKYGKCRPYLKWMAIPIAAVTIICFLPIYPNNPGGFAAISIVYIIWSIVYTIADVPYWGLSTSMTNNTTKRGNLLTVARLFCTVGAGLVTIIVPLVTAGVTEKYGLNAGPYLARTYFLAAVVCVVAAVPMFFYGFKNTTERFTSTSEPPSLGHNLKLLTKNKPLLLIVISGILGAAKMAYTYTGGLYFAKYVLSDVSWLGMKGEALYTIITMAVVPGGLISSVMVPWFTRHFGKRNTFIYSHLLGFVVMLVMFIVGWSTKQYEYSNAATLIICLIGLVLLGIPFGISNIMTYALIGDTVEYLEFKTGERAEGICFAMQTLINKVGMAVGAFIGVLAYYMAGIEANNVGSLTSGQKDIMWLMLIGLGCLSMLGAAVPMFFYKFNEKAQREAVEAIAARKAENSSDKAE
jgi:sugar (glycoside-pentoside-hexuronide) transporter